MRTAKEIEAAIERDGARVIADRKDKATQVAGLLDQRHALDAQLADAVTTALAVMSADELLSFIQATRSDLAPWLDDRTGRRRRRTPPAQPRGRARPPVVTTTTAGDQPPDTPAPARPAADSAPPDS